METASHLTGDSDVLGSSAIFLSQGPAESSTLMCPITSASCFGATAPSAVSELLLSIPCASDPKTENLSLVLASNKEYISQEYCNV